MTRISNATLLAATLSVGLLVGATLAQSPAPQSERSKEKSRVVVPTPVRGKKLILKDGSHQLVREWEIKGDRVRYYSVERSMWEEIPTELVDFDATKKAEAEEAKSIEQAREEIREAAAIREAEEINVDSSIRVGPNTFLPDDDGMYAVDCPAGQPEARCNVLPLATLGANVKTDKKRALGQILASTVGIPLVSGKQRVTVPGKQATLRIASGQPEFYIRLEDNHEPEMELIVAKVKGSNREIDVLTEHFTGQKSSQRNIISVERWPVAKRVYRLTMSQTLPPGEYVLAEIVPAPEGQEMNLLVWDFGVDPPAAAPAAPPKKK